MAYFRKRGNSWEYRIKYNDRGKQKTLSKSGFPTKAAAKAASVLVEEKLFRGGIDEYNKGNILFEDWLKQYKSIRDVHRRESSNIAAKNGQQKLLERFSGKRLKDLTRSDYQIFINELLFEMDYSKNTVTRIHGEMMAIINLAVEHDQLDRNKLRGISITKEESEDKLVFLTLDEVQRLLDAVEPLAIYKKVMVHLLLNTGIRSGELLGLHWTDVDFENKMITIDKQRTKQGLGPTKTKTSNRTIFIDEDLLELLQEYKEWQINNLEKGQKLSYVMVDHKGKEFYITKPQDMMKDFLRYAGLQPRKSTHLLRHTHAVLLLEAGVDIKTVSNRLGHKDINITANTYLHVTQNHEKNSVEKFINYLQKRGEGVEKGSNP